MDHSLHTDLLSDTLHKIYERVSYVRFKLRTSLRLLVTFLVIAVCSYNYDLNSKHGNLF